jgi:ferredoxin
MASSNLLAMDIAACTVIGYPAGEIPVNKEALSRGFWLTSIGEIEYPGLRPEEARIPDFVKVPFKNSDSQLLDFILPRPLRKLKDSFAPKPIIRQSTCVRCGDCDRICASRAIDIEGEGKERRFVIDKRRCIRCFCCHEICPAKAIDIVK